MTRIKVFLSLMRWDSSHGGSAGGYAVLQIATSLPNAFAAGAPHYGISDMQKLYEIAHKFEYHLCARLMGGKYDYPDVWKERSPIYHTDKITMPLLVSSSPCFTLAYRRSRSSKV